MVETLKCERCGDRLFSSGEVFMRLCRKCAVVVYEWYRRNYQKSL